MKIKVQGARYGFVLSDKLHNTSIFNSQKSGGCLFLKTKWIFLFFGFGGLRWFLRLLHSQKENKNAWMLLSEHFQALLKTIWWKAFNCEKAKTKFCNILLLAEAWICLPLSVTVCKHSFSILGKIKINKQSSLTNQKL